MEGVSSVSSVDKASSMLCDLGGASLSAPLPPERASVLGSMLR